MELRDLNKATRETFYFGLVVALIAFLIFYDEIVAEDASQPHRAVGFLKMSHPVIVTKRSKENEKRKHEESIGLREEGSGEEGRKEDRR